MSPTGDALREDKFDLKFAIVKVIRRVACTVMHGYREDEPGLEN